MIVSSVLTEIKTAAVLNSQGGCRGGESGRESENQESKQMDKSPFSALLPCPPPFLGKPMLVVSPCPPSPLCICTLTSRGFGTFSAATGTEDGVRLVGDSGRFLCFCLGLSLSFRLCKRNQKVLEG